jgi:hypothetical protein
MESTDVKVLNVFRSELEIQASIQHTLVSAPIRHPLTEMTHTFQTSFKWTVGVANAIEHMKQNRVIFSTMLRDAWIDSMVPTTMMKQMSVSRQDIIVRFLAIQNDGRIDVEIGCVDSSLSVFLRNDMIRWTTNATILTQMMEPRILE